MLRVYCAGPLFNPSERAEMESIASTLELSGFSTFLPHRDGLEFAQIKPALERCGASPSEAARIIDKAIFALDTYQLLRRCDVVVANLNGRVPDEGTIVEATLAWHSGKPLVLYKTDVRSMLSGSDNPMVTGLGDFETINDLSVLPAAIERVVALHSSGKVSGTMELGASIATLRNDSDDVCAVAAVLYQNSHRKSKL
ncbi:nucleoside 2-deoxyribosyltransferase [uncultured Caballeronia sp.]|uniref:nucleoside 2-deoxyribosyltransferase n=1 Tax=uncultured Caballeronia sp. TaxID=1827198 RepID=UPI0035CAB5BA